MSSHDHPSHHAHSSHQHGAPYNPNVHSPHRHNHPSHSEASHMQKHTATSETTKHSNKIDKDDKTTQFTSQDASTDPHARSTTKLMGDIKGAVHGVSGSLQAATGTLFRQKGMAERGFDKMNEEDARLAAKSGKPPLGTETRGKIVLSEEDQEQDKAEQALRQHKHEHEKHHGVHGVPEGRSA